MTGGMMMSRIAVNFCTVSVNDGTYVFVRYQHLLAAPYLRNPREGEEKAPALRHKIRFRMAKFFCFSGYLVLLPSFRVVSFN
jgi:hypothetical protein